MKTKNIILIAFIVLSTSIVSCKKDHDIPTGKVFHPEHGGDTLVPGGDTLVPALPYGGLPGLFSVSASQRVWFSKGNLQYKSSINTWRFAPNQYDYVGDSNANISSTYSEWIDLFGWGTSGYNHGAVCFQPWSISMTESDYRAYGSNSYNLDDQTGHADWGYNRIINGGNVENMWRTLTISEWMYVLNTRNTNSGVRYAKAQVNDEKGLTYRSFCRL